MEVQQIAEPRFGTGTAVRRRFERQRRGERRGHRGQPCARGRQRFAFPGGSLRAVKAQRLLGIHGAAGARRREGAWIADVADMCYTLGRACASTGMIFAMHQTKVACLVRHGTGSAWHRGADAPVVRRTDAARVLDHRGPERRQHPLQRGAVEHATATEISLVRNATVISYGAQADGIVTIARRANDAAASDQVLLAITKDDYTLERASTGRRSACAAPAAPASS